MKAHVEITPEMAEKVLAYTSAHEEDEIECRTFRNRMHTECLGDLIAEFLTDRAMRTLEGYE